MTTTIIIRLATEQARIIRERHGRERDREYGLRHDGPSARRLGNWLRAQQDTNRLQFGYDPGYLAYYVEL